MKPIAWQTKIKTGAIFMGDLIITGHNFFEADRLANRNENWGYFYG